MILQVIQVQGSLLRGLYKGYHKGYYKDLVEGPRTSQDLRKANTGAVINRIGLPLKASM